jgi:hypothetical protein
MNYKRLHDNIILKAQSRPDINEYTEKHHILPRCLNGSDDISNIVALTGKEHYLIHWLLCKIYTNNPKLVNAFLCMTYDRWGNRYHSRSFTYAREAYSKIVSERQKLRVGKLNSFFGKHHTEEFKRNKSIERTTNQIGENNFMYKKTFYERWVELYGKKKANALLTKYKRNMKIACTGEKNGFYNKKHKKSTIKQLSESKKKIYDLTSPTGVSYIRSGVLDIAKEFNLHIKTLQRYMGCGKIPEPIQKGQCNERINTTGWEIKHKD